MATSSPLPPLAHGENLLPVCMRVIRATTRQALAWAPSWKQRSSSKRIRRRRRGLADPKAIAELSDYMISDIVNNNNRHQQEWAEYYDKGQPLDRSQRVCTGLRQKAAPLRRASRSPARNSADWLRCMKSHHDDGPDAEKYTIKDERLSQLPASLLSRTCVFPALPSMAALKSRAIPACPNFPYLYMIPILKDQAGGVVNNSEDGVIWNQVIGSTVDDLGLVQLRP